MEQPRSPRGRASFRLVESRPVLVPACLAFATALAAISYVGWSEIGFADGPDYLRAAEALRAGRDYPREGGSLPFFRAPGYALLIAGLWSLFPFGVPVIKLAQAVLFALTCVIIGRFGAFVSGSRLAGLGGLLYACNPFALHMVARVQTETLFIALYSLSLLLLVIAATVEERRAAYGVLAGAGLGAAALVRPTVVGVSLALIAISPGLSRLVRARSSLGPAWAARVTLGLLLCVLPWTYCNRVATGELILVNDVAGYALWAGNHPITLQVYENRAADTDPEFVQSVLNTLNGSIAPQRIREWNESHGYDRLSHNQRQRAWVRAALQNFRDDARLSLKLLVYKFTDYWRPWLNPKTYPTAAVALSAVIFGALFLLGAAGAANLVGDPGRGRVFLVMLAVIVLVSTAVHVVFIAMVRYRLSYIEPVLHALAGVAVGVRLSRAAPSQPRHPALRAW